MPLYPFDCSRLLSSPFYRCTCPRRRNRDPSKSDADSRPLRSTSPCSRVHSCICRWCSARGRCSRVLRTRRVAGSTLCLSNRDCIGTRRLCTRLNQKRRDYLLTRRTRIIYARKICQTDFGWKFPRIKARRDAIVTVTETTLKIFIFQLIRFRSDKSALMYTLLEKISYYILFTANKYSCVSLHRCTEGETDVPSTRKLTCIAGIYKSAILKRNRL